MQEEIYLIKNEALWQQRLANNGLAGFDNIWNLKAPWFEAPNERRGGWSGVNRIDLTCEDQQIETIFIKRQCNHVYKNLCHPRKGKATLYRELKAIDLCQKNFIPIYEAIYFGVKQDSTGTKAILITKALTDYQSLDQWVQQWQQQGWPDKHHQKNIITALAKITSKMHKSFLQHRCYHPKHIFLKFDQEYQTIDIKLIDLEMLRYRLLPALRDLNALNRHSIEWSRTDRLLFYKVYLGIDKLNFINKLLWRRLQKRYRRKYGTNDLPPVNYN